MKQPARAAISALAISASIVAFTCSLAPAQPPAPNPQPSWQRIAADPQMPLADQITAILAAPAVARDHWGIQVNALDGTPIYSLNEAQLFRPASNAKLFTTAAALAMLGPDKTIDTYVRGTLDDTTGTVEGDLSIVGEGDANLSGRQFPYSPPASQLNLQTTSPDTLQYFEDLADQLVARGVKSVTGDIIGDDTAFPWEPYPIGWDADDTLWGYGAPVSALSIADNQLRMTITPTSDPGGKNATVTLNQNSVPYYSVISQVLLEGAKRPTEIQVEREPGSRTLRVYGRMATGSPADSEEIAIADPAEYAAIAFKQMLQARGVKVQGGARADHQFLQSATDFLQTVRAPQTCDDVFASPRCEEACYVDSIPSGKPLAIHRSVPLAQDVVLTNKISENLHAELMLHQLAYLSACSTGSTALGVRNLRAFLIHAGLDPNDFIFYDGSGLSTHDLVTPRAIAKLLSYAAHDTKTGQPQPWFAVWKSSLPVGGEDGTLAARFPAAPLKDHVFAKTGTLGESRALSGYLDAASGRTVIFSILVDNHLPGTSDDRDAMDRIVAAIQAAE